MTMKSPRKTLSMIAVVIAAVLTASGGWLALHSAADAQGGLPAPSNVRVASTSAGQAVVSWDAVAGAAGYNVRWVDLVAARSAYDAGNDWVDLIETTDVSDGGANSHTVTIDSDAVNYGFAVGSKSASNTRPNWSGWETVTSSVARGDAMTDTMADDSDAVAVLAAALSVSRHASTAVNIAAAPTQLGMNRESLVRDGQALLGHKAALDAQIATLQGKGFDDRVNYIQSQINQLVANVASIQRGRPLILRELGASALSLRELQQRNTRQLYPNINRGLDDQFYHMMTSFPEVGSVGVSNISQDDVLRYAHLSDLSATATLAHTFLAIASFAQEPTYVARTQENYDAMAQRIGLHIEFLSDDNISASDRTAIEVAQAMLDDASGEDNFFERLERRLELVHAERALIQENAEILHRLQVQIEALAADAQGLAAPPVPTPSVEGAMDPGITKSQILFGQSAALTGPSDVLGKGMKLGIEAAFHEVNQAGGVNGRQLTLKSSDDGYESDAAFLRTQQLIINDRVFGLIGAVGTPTSRAASPLAHAAAVPFVAPFTGAQFLRAGDQTNVLNFRASYYQETERMVDLLADAGVTRVAVMHQNDSFGTDGLAGVENALASRDGMELVASWYYLRNTDAVKAAAVRISEADPEAVIIIGAYRPAARGIELLRSKLGTDTIFMAVSFVGSNALAQELGNAGEGVYVTQVVPLPSDETVSAVASYRAALSAYDSEATPGFISLEGYLAGRLAIARLQACGADVSRECFLDVFAGSTDVDIDGLQLQFGSGDNQGSDDVYLTVINANGEYELADSVANAQ